MILVIDNFDSFVHNLARYVRELGEEAVVERADALSVEDVEAMSPSHIIISPRHDRSGVLADVPSPFQAARYHSLVIARSSVPSCLRVTATSADDGEIMAVEHRQYPVVGVQFHPESAATEYGYWILDRFLHGPVARDTVRATGADGLDHVHLDEATPVFVPPAVELVR